VSGVVSGRLIQLSGAIVDHVFRVVAVPRAGEEATVLGSALAAGGGFNAMAAARRSGLEVVYAGGLGDGPFAEIVARALAAEGIVAARPRRAGRDQGCCVTLIDAAGERTFVAAEGADGEATDADLAGLDLRPDDWLLLSGYALGYAGSRDALGRWLDGARGRRLVFDPAPLVAAIAPELRARATHAALWISANAAEAAVLTGLADPAAAAMALAADRPAGGGALLRIGAAGCWLALPGAAALHLPGHPVTAIDTNGAGDAHVGAFVAALADGAAPERAAAYANVAAALSTTRAGPATAPTRAAIHAALAEVARDQVQKRRRP
jgi:sugar/nucleoside kinase (ribokinase family)